ncbi:hypothetical protein H6F43_03750 [Leptolyngbya sp. FACHB-36]|uniref:hypothetical protein n=1 Tax=Leptolyngbya sp. FACHB-36 TaxID=2692808 RepID=UPI00168020EA|nr:hypothetical protein [Leptolyngbya sp. FACHB-36]MBD2019296.1 hypothetical protein [Leptolyngbya sp. FACHB-36]
MAPFIPLYSVEDLTFLLRTWADSSLDGIHSKGHAALGVVGCDRVSHGFRAQSLAERYTVADLHKTIEEMAQDAEPGPTYLTLLLLKHIRQSPLQDLARAFDYPNNSVAQSELVAAQDEFMRRLLARS